MTPYPYTANEQISRYISQFMRAMGGFQVRESAQTSNYRRVPIRYGSMSRLVAYVLQRGDTYNINAIPLLAANLTSIDIDKERKVSHHHQDTITLIEDDDYKALNRIVGPAIRMNIELSIYADSTSQLYEILEQIMLIYNPRITIQTDNNRLNADYITEISLDGIVGEIQYPMGTEQSLVMQSLNFVVPARLRYPHTVTNGIIEEIIANIYDDSGDALVHLADIHITGDDI